MGHLLREASSGSGKGGPRKLKKVVKVNKRIKRTENIFFETNCI
jgi:hypothetical protein